MGSAQHGFGSRKQGLISGTQGFGSMKQGFGSKMQGFVITGSEQQGSVFRIGSGLKQGFGHSSSMTGSFLMEQWWGPYQGDGV